MNMCQCVQKVINIQMAIHTASRRDSNYTGDITDTPTNSYLLLEAVETFSDLYFSRIKDGQMHSTLTTAAKNN